jgi:predicted Zn-dependent protease
VALAAVALVIAAAALLLTRNGDDDPGTRAAEATRTPEATTEPEKTAKPEKTTTPDPTPEPTATPEPTPEPTETPAATGDGDNGDGNSGNGNGGGRGLGNDPTALQLEAYNRNQAGDPAGALPYAEKAVKRCEGSTQVSPCAYALYEYARALRGTGNPQAAVQVLEERLQRFPDDQRATVERELAEARAEAGGG